MLEPYLWPQSTVAPLALNEMVNGRLLMSTGDSLYPVWMVPPAVDMEPNPPYDYFVSFVRLHERSFTALASQFMRELCHHYGVELHNFAPNAISQAASFVAVCEGFLEIPANWTSGSIFSTTNFILSPRARGGRAGRFAPAASHCGTRVRSCTRCAP
jgi:hypothetical protein